MPINFPNPEGLQSSCEAEGLEVRPAPNTAGRSDWFIYLRPDNEDERQDRLARYHLHVNFTYNDDPPHRINRVLARSQDNHFSLIDAAQEYGEDQWATRLNAEGMDGQTVDATESFVRALNGVGAYHPHDEL